MDYLEDIPERLVEWIEMQLMTGADVITAYTYHVPPKMRQVLDHYVNKKVLTVVTFSDFSMANKKLVFRVYC